MRNDYSSSTDNFKNLIETNRFFVDKTLFIKEFFLGNSEEVSVITRPRRFGKTLNMSMLKYFLDIRENSENLFKNFNIWHDKEAIAHMNKYPVIYVDFKASSSDNYSDFIAFIKSRMSRLYSSHKYLLETVDGDDANKFKEIIKTKAFNASHQIRMLKDSLHDLCRYLYNHYKKKVIVLIDEYDNPMHSSYGKEHANIVNEFFKDFYSDALKGNEYIHRALITGILRIAKESIFSGFNNAKVYTILDKKYSQYFGFTQEEIAPIIKKERLDLNLAKYWYNGYNFRGVTIYNPFSIINYLGDREPGNYWSNTASVQRLMITSSLKCHSKIITRDLNKLVFGGSVLSSVGKSLVFDELSYREESFWTLLFHAGYLTNSSRKRDRLRIPNNEIKGIFKEIIADILKGVSPDNFISMLIQNEDDLFRKKLSKILEQNLSYYDITNENMFHVMMMQYAIALDRNAGSYYVKSNPEGGKGRPDIVVWDLKGNIGLIIEIKKADDSEKLKQTAEEGMNQIKDKKYYAIFNDKVKSVKLASIAFEGKEFFLQTDKIVINKQGKDLKNKLTKNKIKK